MVSLYDPRNSTDQNRVEQILATKGINYSTRREPVRGIGPAQILVAEEDLPFAEEALLKR